MNKKISIKLVDSNFSHHPVTGPSISTSPGNDLIPTFIEWYRGEDYREFCIFTDNHLDEVKSCISRVKIAWILEPRDLVPGVYDKIKSIHNMFDLVLSHDDKLIREIGEKARFIPFGGSWIKESDFCVYDKTKNISTISSYKRQLEGHLLRHEAISRFSKPFNIDTFGNGYSSISDKLIGFKDYRFHLVIENVSYNYWFTEKLIDAFATGSIPIYWGAPGIGKYFNESGILDFHSLDGLEYILNNFVNEEYYLSRLDAIHDNFERSKKYRIAEDFMFELHLKDLIK